MTVNKQTETFRQQAAEVFNLLHEREAGPLGRVFCWLGLHAWRCSHEWQPNADAPIITSWTRTFECRCCEKKYSEIDYYDPETGAPTTS